MAASRDSQMLSLSVTAETTTGQKPVALPRTASTSTPVINAIKISTQPPLQVTSLMVPDLFVILGMMGGSRHPYVSILMGPRLVYDRRAEGAPDLSIISSDGVPDLLTDFVSVGLLIRLPRDHLSDQQIMTAGRSLEKSGL